MRKSDTCFWCWRDKQAEECATVGQKSRSTAKIALNAISLCSACGAAIPPDAPAGFCPKCELTGALALGASSSRAVVLPRTFGDYELIEEIARGGMGVVYKARQAGLKRTVAVKMILGGQLASVADVQRFRAEAEAAAHLQHPNIVAIHEVAEHEGQHFFSMDYVEGKSLAEIIRHTPLPAAEAASYVKTIAEAIHYAHQRGILHRDLKPSNVLIDSSNQPRITDFGLARKMTLESDLTLTGQVLGSPNFMPPEQAAGRIAQFGPPSDVYSLGAILFCLLTGRPPFVAETLADTLEHVRHSTPLSPRILNPSIPRDLETICLKSLEKDPRRRYGTAQELADELARFLAGEPIHARPVTKIEKAWRWSRRHPAVSGLSAGLLIVAVAGFAAITRQWQRAERNAEAERVQRQRAEDISARFEIERAEDAFESGASAIALAHLARVLQQNPSNSVAAGRVISALTYRPFVLPAGEPLQHGHEVCSARFSPDGQQVVTASSDNTARIWEADSAKPITQPLKHAAQVRSATFSPDGQWVLTASDDKTARIWNARTGEPLSSPLQHQAAVRSAEFSFDSRKALTASADNTARVWDARSGEPTTPPLLHNGPVVCARFSPDGRTVASASSDKTVRLWDVDSGQAVTEPLKHRYAPELMEFSPDGKAIAVAESGGSVQICNSRTGEKTFEFMHERLWSMQFSPDGQKLVTASYDQTARVWDAKTGQPLVAPLKHDDWVRYARFSPDGQRIVTTSDDKTARVWDARTGRPLTEPLRHRLLVMTADFSPEGQRVVTASEDKTARIWDLRPRQVLAGILKHEARVWWAEFSPDGQQLVTASEDKTARIWDIREGQTFMTAVLQHDVRLWAARFSPDGQKIATAWANAAQIWNAAAGQPVTGGLWHEERVWCVHFSPDGQRVVTASSDKTARLWDARTGEPIGGALQHEGIVYYATFSPDGQRVVTASWDGTARVWDCGTSRPLTGPLQHDGHVYYAEFSARLERVVTASGDRTARIWDARTGQPLTAPLRHDSPVKCARFSPDGQRVVTASDDKTARVWDATSGQPLTPPLKHDNWVTRAQFSPDGRRVLTASDDQTARVWDARTGQPLTESFRHEGRLLMAQFSPDGQRVVTACENKTARIWETPAVPSPSPGWLADLAEAVAGLRLNQQGIVESTSWLELPKLKQRIEDTPANDFYTAWAKWFLADRAKGVHGSK